MTEFDGLTKSDTLKTLVSLYRKCMNRDTSKGGCLGDVKVGMTIDGSMVIDANSMFQFLV